jgi:LmbE family N-acetylglucosaminyl deacetylase
MRRARRMTTVRSLRAPHMPDAPVRPVARGRARHPQDRSNFQVATARFTLRGSSLSSRTPAAMRGETEDARATRRLDAFVTADGVSCALPRTLIVVAHPDDETIGAASRLPFMSNGGLLHVTNGSPRDLRDARAAGLKTMVAYAAARSDELAAALALVQFPLRNAHTLNVVDQEAPQQVAEITRSIADEIARLVPDVVLTHPYEGGHPDHDATALAVHAACALVRGRSVEPPSVLELASYHDRDGELATGEFLPRGHAPERAITLSPAQRALKAALIACFHTQRATLAPFGLDVERFRVAPAYDFLRPPHAGTLRYERFAWGMTSERFCEHAAAALHELRIEHWPWR